MGHFGVACIVYQVNKKTGIKYAYESISYWDKEKQQPRSKRKYIGRVDENTGEIIREAKPEKEKRKTSDNSRELDELSYRIKELEETVNSMNTEINSLRSRNRQLEDKIRKIRFAVAEEFSDV